MMNWTLSRNSSKDYVVKVDVTGLNGWKTNIQPSYFVLDDENPYRIISLRYHVPIYPEKEVREATVHFQIRELNGTETTEIEKDITFTLKSIKQKHNTIIGDMENPLPKPLDNRYGAFILNLAIWFGIGFVFFLMITPVVERLTRKTETELDDVLLKFTRRPVLILIFIYGFINSIFKLGLSIKIQATIYQVYLVATIAIGMLVTYRIFDGIVMEYGAEKAAGLETYENVLQPVLDKIGAIIIVIGGSLLILKVLGIQITGLLAGAGVAGLVIAFAAQDTLSNFFSGMHLLLDRPFKIGDVILLESGEYCRIRDVGMRSTKMYDIFEHESIVLPNNSVANQKIINLSEPDTKMKVKVEVGVAYGSDVDQVKKILRDVIDDHPDIMTKGNHAPTVRFKEFADSSLNFSVRFWIDHYMKQWEVASDIRKRIDDRFKDAEITIPFPQRTVWLEEEN